MSIQSEDLRFFKSAVVLDGATNGGRISANEIVSGVRNNVFPVVTQAQRAAGLTRKRKVFAKSNEDEGLALLDAMVHLRDITQAEDRVYFTLGTQTDVQGDLAGTERTYGAGALKTTLTAGDASIVVEIEDSGDELFVTGDTIWIGDETNEEYFHNVTVSQVGDEVTITLDGADQVLNGYTAGEAHVAAVYVHDADLEAGAGAVTVTSAGDGDYDDTGNPVETDNRGTISEDWTISFTSATAFTITGANVGEVGTGNTSSDAAPSNSDFSGTVYFTLRSAGFSGTFAEGDTLTFTTTPAAIPIWMHQVVPTGAASGRSDFTLGFVGASE